MHGLELSEEEGPGVLIGKGNLQQQRSRGAHAAADETSPLRRN